jgi:hypothetical protein
MTRPTNTFHILRRHRAGLGRLVLVLFALAAASASAAPCLAMGVPNAPVAHYTDAHVAPMPASATAHDHSHAVEHDHSHALEHDHAAPAADQEGGSHGSCSHCPLSAGMTANASLGSHASCSVSDHASDGAKPSWSPPVFKHVLATALVELLPIEPRHRLAFAQRPHPEATSPSVALNLRHCVLLI